MPFSSPLAGISRREDREEGDRFEETIRRYLIPMERLPAESEDSTYFLRKSGEFVFAQGYCHPPGGVYGKIITFPQEGGPINLFGRPYNCTHRKPSDGDWVLTSYREQLRIQYDIDPSLRARAPTPPFAGNHIHFTFDEFRGFFDNRRSLRIAMESHPRLADIVHAVSADLDFPVEGIGCTGSLAYGNYNEEEEDVDLVFYGTLRQNEATVRRIQEILCDPRRHVREYGRSWPLRFIHDGVIICPFFVYWKKDQIPLRDFTMEVLRDEVKVMATVSDVTHSIYTPLLVGLTDVTLDGVPAGDIDLIAYDSSLRGEFLQWDRIDLQCRLVEVRSRGRTQRGLLIISRSEIVKQVRS